MEPKFKVGEKVLAHPGPYQIVGTVATVLQSKVPGEAHQYVICLNSNDCLPSGHGYQVYEEDRLLPYQDPMSVEHETVITALKAEIDALKASIDNFIRENDIIIEGNVLLMKENVHLKNNERKIRAILTGDSVDD